MEKVDFVLVGAEGVVESGGIINKVSKSVHSIIVVVVVVFVYANHAITKNDQRVRGALYSVTIDEPPPLFHT